MRQWVCQRNVQPWLALAGFSLLSLLLRFTAFPRSVIDWDESVFLLMGRAFLPFLFDVLVRKLRYQITGNMLAWLGLFLTPVYLIGARNLSRQHKRNFLYVGIWFGFALIDVIFPRRLFGHYFLQLLPPLSVLLGLTVAEALIGADARRRGVLVLLILLGPLLPRAYPELVRSAQAIYHIRGGRAAGR